MRLEQIFTKINKIKKTDKKIVLSFEYPKLFNNLKQYFIETKCVFTSQKAIDYFYEKKCKYIIDECVKLILDPKISTEDMIDFSADATT